MNIKPMIVAVIALLAVAGTGSAGTPDYPPLSLSDGTGGNAAAREAQAFISYGNAEPRASVEEPRSLNTRAPGAMSGLEEYLAYAEAQNPALRAAYNEWRAAAARSGYAGALPDPVVSYMYFGEPVETRVGPQEQRFSVRQAVPWFGTLGARKEIASKSADAAYQKYQSKKLQLLYEVKTAYYEYYYLGRDLAVTRDNLDLLTFWESIVRARYRLALQQHPDVTKIQVELGKLENRLRTVESGLDPAGARLRAAVNLPDSVPLPIPETISIDESELDRDAVVRAALENNPDLKSLIHVIEKEDAGIRLAGKSTRPGFVMGFDYIQTGEALDPDMPDSGKDPWMVSVGVTLPVWF